MKRVCGIFLFIAVLGLAQGSVRAQTRQAETTRADTVAPGEIALKPQMHEASIPGGAPPPLEPPAEAHPPVAPASGPMSVSGKLSYAARRGFGPRAAASAAFLGAYAQARDTDRGFGQGGEGYGKRVASTYGTYVTRELVGSFALAGIFRQDPRFHRSPSSGFLRRLNHAITREFIASGDAGGSQFNISRMGGAMAAVLIAGQWRPAYGRGDAAEDAGLVIGADILQNIVAEFWPDIRKKLRH